MNENQHLSLKVHSPSLSLLTNLLLYSLVTSASRSTASTKVINQNMTEVQPFVIRFNLTRLRKSSEIVVITLPAATEKVANANIETNPNIITKVMP
mmetsp:Transcript_29713/g.45457  ORF Transcript_29713/g.45457 Transcript_29713/m.45457 type:complete len:96 (+) Transcript_29713:344-631(+)